MAGCVSIPTCLLPGQSTCDPRIKTPNTHFVTLGVLNFQFQAPCRNAMFICICVCTQTYTYVSLLDRPRPQCPRPKPRAISQVENGRTGEATLRPCQLLLPPQQCSNDLNLAHPLRWARPWAKARIFLPIRPAHAKTKAWLSNMLLSSSVVEAGS